MQNPPFRVDFAIFSEQTDLTGLRHAGKGPQRLELLNMGLAELVAGGGEFLNGDELLSLALLHGGQRRRFAQTVYRYERRQQGVIAYDAEMGGV